MPVSDKAQPGSLAERLKQFLDQYANEKDRTAVILVAAKVDYLLGQAISGRLLPNTGTSDELLDTDRPLGTLSARINAAYRLGIIDGAFARALHIVRRVRNDFAHSYHDATFDDGRHRDRISELVRPLLNIPTFSNLRAKITSENPNFPQPRLHFILGTAFVVGKLEMIVDNVTRVSAGEAVSFS